MLAYALKTYSFILLINVLLLTGCSSIPPRIVDSPPEDLQLQQVMENIADYQGSPVRWGGAIVGVENEEQQTWVQVLSRDLNYFGQPVSNGTPGGRFLVRFEGFLDPEIYAKDLDITVYGTIAGQAERKVGQKTLTLPVVKAEDRYLWPDARRYADYYYPYHDPYYFGYHRIYPPIFYDTFYYSHHHHH